ncbi:hypothetical protein BDN72DRAFT_906372 [Pluteus cervinus]|uniref:Uncharacterized protein n=1 Tax=Pluteus cervinus TaxID=181527 RepID=A0ACD2ZZW0_9AGAR|nr:hypothetical protein BDN72DRAFT_906372 [Pluteus cervinus]
MSITITFSADLDDDGHFQDHPDLAFQTAGTDAILSDPRFTLPLETIRRIFRDEIVQQYKDFVRDGSAQTVDEGGSVQAVDEVRTVNERIVDEDWTFNHQDSDPEDAAYWLNTDPFTVIPKSRSKPVQTQTSARPRTPTNGPGPSHVFTSVSTANTSSASRAFTSTGRRPTTSGTLQQQQGASSTQEMSSPIPRRRPTPSSSSTVLSTQEHPTPSSSSTITTSPQAPAVASSSHTRGWDSIPLDLSAPVQHRVNTTGLRYSRKHAAHLFQADMRNNRR